MKNPNDKEVMQKLNEIADAFNKDPKELTPEMSNVISILTAKPAADDNWDDMLDMLADIREHAKNNGSAIINEDKPMQLRLGWRCTNTNKTWSIRIANFKKSLEKMGPHQKDLISRAIQSQEGKEALTASLNSK